MEDLVYLINLKDVAEDQPIRTKAITRRLFEAHTKIKAQWLDEWTVVDEDPNKVDETVQDAMQDTVQIENNDIIPNEDPEKPKNVVQNVVTIEDADLLGDFKYIEKPKESFIPKKEKPEFSKPKKERKQRVKANQ